MPEERIVLYNLTEDSSRGEIIRGIISDLGMNAVTVTDEGLNETVGYLAGLEGFDAPEEPYNGKGSRAEFMLACGLEEERFDLLLKKMAEHGVSVDHKAVVTEHNREWPLSRMVVDVGDEHEMIRMIISLNDLYRRGNEFGSGEKRAEFSSKRNWNGFCKAMANAYNILRDQEADQNKIRSSLTGLKREYLMLTGMKEIRGKLNVSVIGTADGNYMVTALVRKAKPGSKYKFSWKLGGKTAAENAVPAEKSGEAAGSIFGIKQEQLRAVMVEVSEEDAYGKMEASPEVPAAPGCREEPGRIIRLKKTKQGYNCPEIEGYRIIIYEGEKIEEVTTVPAGEELIEVPGKGDLVKICSFNAVGRSDMTVLTLAR